MKFKPHSIVPFGSNVVVQLLPEESIIQTNSEDMVDPNFGEVIALGPDATAVAIGDLVIFNHTEGMVAQCDLNARERKNKLAVVIDSKAIYAKVKKVDLNTPEIALPH